VRDLVVVGPGQLGRLFGAGALARGIRVTPVRRGDDAGAAAAGVPDAPILVAVGEPALAAVLLALPPARRNDAILVQNELFPADWTPLTPDPTVAVVWLNAKAGRPIEVARPTAVHGRHARLFCELHDPLGLPCVPVDAPTLGVELVAKYAFILAVNALGLRADDTVGAWLARDRALVRSIAGEGIALGEARLGRAVDRAAAEAAIVAAMQALRDMPARGRTARARVERALVFARERGIPAPDTAASLAAA